jgi:hypothetical protein
VVSPEVAHDLSRAVFWPVAIMFVAVVVVLGLLAIAEAVALFAHNDRRADRARGLLPRSSSCSAGGCGDSHRSRYAPGRTAANLSYEVLERVVALRAQGLSLAAIATS